MKITIIGAGNMGGAMAIGLAKTGKFQITATARHAERLEKYHPYGIRTTTDNLAAVKGADVVMYAVEPYQMQGVLEQTAPVLDFDSQLIVSVSPGVKAPDLVAWLGGSKKASIAYVIPNTAIEIGESMTYVSPITASDAQAQILKEIFDTVGKTCVVPLSLMMAGTKTASCGIAFAMRYIAASVEGAKALGLDPETAVDVVCQTVKGAAQLIAHNGTEPQFEIDRVTTPGGITIRGLEAMEAAGFSDAVKRGMGL